MNLFNGGYSMPDEAAAEADDLPGMFEERQKMTLKDFIRLYGTAHCNIAANDVFRKIFRRNIATYFSNPYNGRATLEGDLRMATIGLSLDEIKRLADIFQQEAEKP